MSEAPVVYRLSRQPAEGLAQSAESFAELDEVIPYPDGVLATSEDAGWPPPGFSTPPSEDDMTATTLSSVKPKPYDLEWVQGDTPEFSWLFTDVLWLPEDPEVEDPDAPEWQHVEWAATVRNPYLFSSMSADRWVPVNNSQYVWWRSNSWVANFVTSAELYIMPEAEDAEEGDPIQYATKVSLFLPTESSRQILPGSHYRWDLQTRNRSETEDDYTDDIVLTHLSGKARVLNQWTTS